MQRFLSIFCIVGSLLAIQGATASADDGFRSLFDGKTLDGWDGNPKLWRVEDGVITGETTAENPTPGNTFLIWRGGEPADFELTCEFKACNEQANTGIQYRSREEPEQWGKWVIGGYQADVDGGDQYTGILYEERGRGIVAQRGEKVALGPEHKVEKFINSDDVKNQLKKNDWNTYRIVARGNHIQQYINHQLTVDVTDNDPQAQRAKGLIALQLHAGPPMKVQFRNIQLKEFAPANAASASTDANKKKIVFVAGKPSHGYADHEHAAACELWAKCLTEAYPGLETVVHRNGWPEDPSIFNNATAVLLYSDGGGGNPMLAHLDEIDAMMKRGVGFACIHFSVEVPAGKAGELMKNWIGGYFEQNWSVNPFWNPTFSQFPEHPITRGLRPFTINDEWYFHMRFRDDMAGVTPILTAVPPDPLHDGPDGPYSGNPAVRARKGIPEHLAWACERPDGGRGFGFTGGHIHWNWAQDDYRRIVLNAIAWIAKLDIPAGGVPSKTPTFEDLEAGQDKPQPKEFDRDAIRKRLEEWKKQSAMISSDNRAR